MNTPGSASNSTRRVTDNRSLTLYLTCRTAVITFLLGGAAFFYIKGSTNQQVILPLFTLICISYFSALISALILKYVKSPSFFSEIQISWDLIFVTVLILFSGGVESVFSFAYLLIIVATSFLLNRSATIIVATCSTLLFGGALSLQYFGYLNIAHMEQGYSDGAFFTKIFVHSVAFFLTAGLSGTLAERWQRTAAQLQKKTIDFADLERMNRTILSHINSGLMLVGPKGRVRSFNRAAEEITGLSLIDVYDQDAILLFPGLSVALASGAQPARRSECHFTKQSGDVLTLGYATTTAWGNQGEFIGTLVTFQDLTQLKKTEEHLKQADRLAAVGRLAAGMAHEIRNPLAAISGSVQILMESKSTAADDLGLMQIVVKEADRLNNLLTDFLDFARPKKPDKKMVNIVIILNELLNMLHTDKRFKGVNITVEAQKDEIFVSLDRDLFFQILWDLAVNAMEAMDGRGILRFSVKNNGAQNTCVMIDDSGPGISEEAKGRLFEPFFSTKESGSGLGLASVYAVMEMHGGNVSIDESSLGGAQFILCFRGRVLSGEE